MQVNGCQQTNEVPSNLIQIQFPPNRKIYGFQKDTPLSLVEVEEGYIKN